MTKTTNTPSGKQIVFVDEISSDWRSGYFGMHRQMATAVCRSLEEAASHPLFQPPVTK